jgi:septum formation protein
LIRPVSSPARPEEQTTFFHKITPARIILVMSRPILLASASETRLALLRNAGIQVTAHPAHIDEETIRHSLEAEDAHPQDIADTLAEMKARKIAEKHPEALVLGCDQVLEFRHRVWGKPKTPAEAHEQLAALRGQSHRLLSALVVYDRGVPVWRHVGRAELTMRNFSVAWLAGYISRNWDSIRHSAGAYRLEEEGVRLFSSVEGDYFTILGLPLLPLLARLELGGIVEA